MQHSRGVIVGVDAAQRVGHDGLAQVAVGIALTHAFVDCVLKRTAHEVHVLTDRGEDHRGSGVLTDRDFLIAGQTAVSDHLVKDGLAERRLLGLLAADERLLDILRQMVIGLHAQAAYQRRHLRNMHFSHFDIPPCENSYRSASKTMLPPHTVSTVCERNANG